jgi:hypothetical protein
MSERVCGERGCRRARFRETGLWTRGNQVQDDMIREAEREGQRDRMRGEPKRLLKGVGGVNMI